MQTSRTIAQLAGPTLVVMVVAELRFWNPDLYAEQITPLIYFAGVLQFLAGLAIVRIHNRWSLSWPLTVTVLGWLLLILGMVRIFFPQEHKAQFENNDTILVIEIMLISLGLFLTFKGYWKASPSRNPDSRNDA